MLGFLSSIEETTVEFLKNMQEAIRTGQPLATGNRSRGQKGNNDRGGASEAQRRTKKKVPLHRMRTDPFTEVCSYLGPEDLCNLAAVSEFSHEVITKHSRIYWKTHCLRTYGTVDMAGEVDYKMNFLRLRTEDLERREAQAAALRRQRAGIEQYRRRGGAGIVGVLADVAWVEDEAIAKTISRKRFMAMATIITDSDGDITKFKAANQKLHGATSFMPHSTAAHSIDGTSHIDLLQREVDASGFLGYAINFIRLAPEHEYLRYTVFWIIFKNLIIFDTVANLFEYRFNLDASETGDFWGVAVEEYAGESAEVFPRLLTRRTAPPPPRAGATTDEQNLTLQNDIRKTKHSYTVLRYT